MLKIYTTVTLEMQKVLDIGIIGFPVIIAYCIKQRLLPKGILFGLSYEFCGPNPQRIFPY